jgi:hypothetical protein
MHTGSAKHEWRWFLTITDPLHQVRQREMGVSFNKAVNYFRLAASKVDALNTIMGHGRNEKLKGKTKILVQNCASNTFFTNHLIYDSSYILLTTHQV